MSVIIRLYQEEDARAFCELNTAWITQNFELEEKDKEILEHPEREIIAKGGLILIAQSREDIIGTAALLPKAPGLIELAKMTVATSHRGRGVGKLLMARIDEEARSMGAKNIWLESNTKLGPAIALYRAHGYRELSMGKCHPTPYSRCNIQMEKTL